MSADAMGSHEMAADQGDERREFWIHSGLALLNVNADGNLILTDEFLRAYFARAELGLIDESCAAERALHAKLQQTPSAEVQPSELSSIKDRDTAENWQMFLRLRERLLRAETVEQAYLSIFEDAKVAGKVDIPPLFIDQLAHILIHHVLVDCTDGLMLRVAELWYRPQKVWLADERVVLADAEALEQRLSDPGMGNLGRLLAQANVKSAGVDLPMLDRANADDYFARSEQHDFAVEITVGRLASFAFCDVLARWTRHMLAVRLKIQPLAQIDDQRWSWHLGLDAQSSLLLDKLYRSEGLTPGEQRRLLLLIRMDFVDLGAQRTDLVGKPVYSALACTEDLDLVFKPQNLLVGLPLADQSTVH
jgi:Family of unknown function (DUF6352)